MNLDGDLKNKAMTGRIQNKITNGDSSPADGVTLCNDRHLEVFSTSVFFQPVLNLLKYSSDGGILGGYIALTLGFQ